MEIWKLYDMDLILDMIKIQSFLSIFFKVVYIIRNPKDVTVSYYHFTNLSIQSGFTGIFGDFVQLFTNGTGRLKLFTLLITQDLIKKYAFYELSVPYGPWWKHVDEHTSKKNVHIIHYEELQEVKSFFDRLFFFNF